jgi:hypothetical protein
VSVSLQVLAHDVPRIDVICLIYSHAIAWSNSLFVVASELDAAGVSLLRFNIERSGNMADLASGLKLIHEILFFPIHIGGVWHNSYISVPDLWN